MTKPTIDPKDAPKRPRGRPPLGEAAKSHAIRKREERERLRAAGIGSATFNLPLTIIDQLGAYAKSEKRDRDDIVEQLLREKLASK